MYVIPGTCRLYIRMLSCIQGRWGQSPTVGPANETAVVGHVSSSSLWGRYSRLQMRSSCPSYGSTMILDGVV